MLYLTVNPHNLGIPSKKMPYFIPLASDIFKTYYFEPAITFFNLEAFRSTRDIPGIFSALHLFTSCFFLMSHTELVAEKASLIPIRKK